MNPLPDRVVIVGLLATVALCFTLAIVSAHWTRSQEPPLLWRDTPGARSGATQL